ncbi:aldehyde dehydrogenase family protein [Mycobacterium xenopi 3993]|nr:aldehyde dehydrogenase family protein [Mycobacterium xenopi 3993]
MVIKPSEMTPVSISELAKIFAQVLPPVSSTSSPAQGRLPARPCWITRRYRSWHSPVPPESATPSPKPQPKDWYQQRWSWRQIGEYRFPRRELGQGRRGAALAILWNQGQACESGARLFIHESIYDRFIDELKAKFTTARVGDPLSPDTQVGSLISKAQLERVLGYVETGRAEGATVLTGGRRLTGGDYDSGFFVEPTILVDVRNDMRVASEEIFGPVLVVIPFKDEDEVIALANDSEYGLAGTVWTQDINRALRVARAVETGRMWVNTAHEIPAHAPFGATRNPVWAAKPTNPCLTRTPTRRTST